MLAARRRSTTLALLVASAVFACRSASTDKQSVRTGHLWASPPEVFTRERLVAERVREAQWLERQLDKPVDNGFEALLDTREASAFAAHVGVGLNAAHDALPDPSLPSSTATSPTLPDPSGIVVSAAKVSALENLKSNQAYRDAVNASLRATLLDDTHDLPGMSMYQFNMTLTVSPAPGETRSAIVLFDLGEAGAGTTSIPVERLRAYMDVFVRELNADSDRVAEVELHRYAQIGGSVPLRVEWLQRTLPTIRMFRAGAERDSAIGKMLTNLDLGSGRPLERSSKADEEGSIALAAALQLISPPAEAWIRWRMATEEEGPHRVVFELRDDAVDLLGKFLDGSGTARVVGVDPKEDARFLSASGARRTDLDLSIAALFADKQIGAQAYAQFLRAKQNLVQGLDRAPVVVGITAGVDEFGWLVGPQFRVNGRGKGKFRLEAGTMQVSFRAVVPTSWRKVSITARAGWIGANGKIVDDSGEPITGAAGASKGSTVFADSKETIEVPLPVDEVALRTVFRHGNGQLVRPVIIDVVGDLREGAQRQSLLIRGEDLWRAPQVFLGGNKASQVDVLSDMRCLMASFDGVTIPAPNSAQASTASLPLSISTSLGPCEAKTLVTVYRKPEPLPFAKLAPACKELIEKGDVLFTIDPKLKPAGYSDVQLVVRRAGYTGWVPIASIPQQSIESSGDIQWRFNVAGVKLHPNWNTEKLDAFVLELGMLLQVDPFADLQRVPNLDGARVLYLKNANARKLTPSYAELRVEANGTPDPNPPKDLVLEVKQELALILRDLTSFTDQAPVDVKFEREGAVITVAGKWAQSESKAAATVAGAEVRNLLAQLIGTAAPSKPIELKVRVSSKPPAGVTSQTIEVEGTIVVKAK